MNSESQFCENNLPSGSIFPSLFSDTLLENEKVAKEFETRGRPINCKKCQQTFKIINPSEKEIWQQNKMICPHCGESYCPLPDTERQLRRLQDSFLESKKEEKYMTAMVKILLPYCRSLILKYFSNKLTYSGQLEYYNMAAVSYFVEEYYAHENFFISVSFANYLYGKIQQAIFGRQEYKAAGPNSESLDYMFQDGHFVAYEDDRSNFTDEISNEEDHQHIYNHVTKIVKEMGMFCNSALENYIRLINIYNFLEDGEKAIDNFFDYYPRLGKYQTLKTLEVIKSELKRSLRNEI